MGTVRGHAQRSNQPVARVGDILLMGQLQQREDIVWAGEATRRLRLRPQLAQPQDVVDMMGGVLTIWSLKTDKWCHGRLR